MSIKQLKGSFTYFDAEDGKYVTANYDDPNVGPITTLQEVERKRRLKRTYTYFSQEESREVTVSSDDSNVGDPIIWDEFNKKRGDAIKRRGLTEDQYSELQEKMREECRKGI